MKRWREVIVWLVFLGLAAIAYTLVLNWLH
jgi:hypothetical protein